MTSRSLRPLLTAGLLALTLTLAGCGEDEPATTTAEPTTPATSETPSSSAPAEPSSTAPAEPEEPAGPRLDVEVAGNDVTPANKSLEVEAGETLTMVLTSDRAGELHVHSSPEQTFEFGAGRTKVEIDLAKPGQVDIEEHESGVLIARVLVK